MTSHNQNLATLLEKARHLHGRIGDGVRVDFDKRLQRLLLAVVSAIVWDINMPFIQDTVILVRSRTPFIQVPPHFHKRPNSEAEGLAPISYSHPFPMPSSSMGPGATAMHPPLPQIFAITFMAYIHPSYAVARLNPLLSSCHLILALTCS
jgi:hypothetical protein